MESGWRLCALFQLQFDPKEQFCSAIALLRLCLRQSFALFLYGVFKFLFLFGLLLFPPEEDEAPPSA